MGLFAVAPLLVIEFLHRVADIFKDYFQEITEASLKENFVSAYEVRDGARELACREPARPYALAALARPVRRRRSSWTR